jgi:aminomethyltransferase
MPVGTPFHERTFRWRRASVIATGRGTTRPVSYEPIHDHEYNALRNGAGLIDISPLFKYIVAGPDAARLVNRVITREAERLEPGRVIYTPWCDEHGARAGRRHGHEARRASISVDGGGAELSLDS